MKVLIVFNHPAPYKVRAFNELSKLIELEVYFERTKARDRPESFYTENKYNFKTYFNNKSYFGNEGCFSSDLKKFIKNNYSKFDFVIMNGYSHVSEMKAISYMSKHKLPFILMINGGAIKKEFFLNKCIKKHFIKKAKYYLSSCRTANEYLKYYGANENSIFVYPYSNFGEEEIIQNKPSEDNKNKIKKNYNFNGNKLFICASQFIKRKNNETLLTVFKNRPNDNLLLIGSGKLLSKYQKFVNENNLKNIVIIPFKKKEELFQIMSCCDGFITLSHYDIYGQTTLEAFACGIPVISSNKVVSSIEFIKNGLNGYLIDENNIDQINNSINNIEKTDFNEIVKTAKLVTFENTAKTIYTILKGISK